jgi:hypothetical protein
MEKGRAVVRCPCPWSVEEARGVHAGPTLEPPSTSRGPPGSHPEPPGAYAEHTFWRRGVKEENGRRVGLAKSWARG